MNETPVAMRYARALIQAAEERDALDRVREDLEGLLDLIRESQDLRAFLSDPLIYPEQKRTAVRRLFSGRIGDLTLNFLLLLCDKRRERGLENIIRSFLTQLDDRRGLTTAYVRTARELSQDQRARLAQRLSAWSGKQVRLDVEVDAGLKAGFVTRMGDHVFDATLEAQLNRMRQRLVSGLS